MGRASVVLSACWHVLGDNALRGQYDAELDPAGELTAPPAGRRTRWRRRHAEHVWAMERELGIPLTSVLGLSPPGAATPPPPPGGLGDAIVGAPSEQWLVSPLHDPLAGLERIADWLAPHEKADPNVTVPEVCGLVASEAFYPRRPRRPAHQLRPSRRAGHRRRHRRRSGSARRNGRPPEQHPHRPGRVLRSGGGRRLRRRDGLRFTSAEATSPRRCRSAPTPRSPAPTVRPFTDEVAAGSRRATHRAPWQRSPSAARRGGIDLSDVASVTMRARARATSACRPIGLSA